MPEEMIDPEQPPDDGVSLPADAAPEPPVDGGEVVDAASTAASIEVIPSAEAPEPISPDGIVPVEETASSGDMPTGDAEPSSVDASTDGEISALAGEPDDDVAPLPADASTDDEALSHDEMLADQTPAENTAPEAPLPLASATGARLAAPRAANTSQMLVALAFEVSLALILIFGGYLRVVGVNWDSFTHQHPDERFLTMVGNGISFRDNQAGYFDTVNSTLNPENVGHTFFVYGTVPIFITRYVAEQADVIRMEWALPEAPLWKQNLAARLLGTEDAPGLLYSLGTGYDKIHLTGRLLNAIADLLAVFIVYLIGRQLYDRRVGLLAAALSAVTVAYIQQAHFATVDSMANLFVVIALYFAARVWAAKDEVKSPVLLVYFILFGVAFGLAVASRINTVPLAAMIAIAGYILLQRTDDDPDVTKLVLVGLAISGVISIVVFRVGQPYSFKGPDFFNVGLNQGWLDDMAQIRSQVSGDVDFPPNHQWTDRPAYLFPLQNMVGYGMGFALGIVVWLGVLWASWRSFRGEWQQHAIPLIWSLLYFAWQGRQWVKPIRYFLPIYPTLILLGSAMLIALWDWSANHKRRPLMMSLAGGTIGLVVVSAAIWGFAFSRIYTRPLTRVAATDWIFENVPGPLNINIELADGSTYFQPLSMPGGYTYTGEEAQHILVFTAHETGTVSEVVVGHLDEAIPDSDPETFYFTIGSDAAGLEYGSQGVYVGDLSSSGGVHNPPFTVPLDKPLEVVTGETYYLISWTTEESGPITLSGSILINETTWDDGLPLRYGGYDPFGGLYTGENLELYWEDTPEKRESMIASLNNGDYIMISSDRQYNSISRLPTRYPMTLAYYRALFSGELGYELAAEFESAPNLGDWVMSDQDVSDPFVTYGNEDPPWFTFPDVEEPFTVYDHPKVFIFKKTADYSPGNTRQMLEAIDLSQIVWMNPYQATAAPTALMLTDELAAIQRAGGTWSEMFDAEGLLNSYQPLGVIAWLLLAWVIGVALFPITFMALRGLPGRGYAFTKLAGILLISWGIWILASLQILPHTRWAIWLVFIAFVGLSALIYRSHHSHINNWVRTHWRYIALVDGLTLGLFLIFLFIRWQNPDLWHPHYGGEKPMDFAYFNAVLKSTYFPPYDPWLAGGYINYYYYGFVLVGVLTKMLGIVPAFAYNLALPLLFAFVGIGAFGVAHNLVEAGKRYMTSYGSAVLAGVVALVLAVLLGNLGQLEVIMHGLSIMAPDVQTMFGEGLLTDLYRAPIGLWRVITENLSIPIGTGQWYWNATRIIPTPAGETQPITEFPLFTFLYADLHAHMIALPLTMLAASWAVSLTLSAREAKGWLQHAMQWLLGALAIGALAATNTWDYPTYLVLGVVAIGYAQWHRHQALNREMVTGVIWRVVVLAVLARLLFKPYHDWYGLGYTKAELWEGSNTELGAYLKVYGVFLFILIPFLLAETRRWMQTVPLSVFKERIEILAPVIAGIAATTVVATIALAWQFDVEIALLVVPMIVWTGLLMIWPRQPPERRAVLAFMGLGLTLTLTVELVRLAGDVGRMNTVFKFYMQVWLLFSVAAGAGVAWIWQQRRTWSPFNREAWFAGLLLLAFVAALYPMTAVPAKMRDRMAEAAPSSLNGLDYMPYATYDDQNRTIYLDDDYAAIRWMQDNVTGSPVIVEASVVEYRLGSRYAINTGLPAVVGWNWHQRQQRAVTPGTLVSDRVEEVREFYTTPDLEFARQFLRRYDVEYIILGEYERAYYGTVEGMAKFDALVAGGVLEVAYSNPDSLTATTIYRVVDLTPRSDR